MWVEHLLRMHHNKTLLLESYPDVFNHTIDTSLCYLSRTQTCSTTQIDSFVGYYASIGYFFYCKSSVMTGYQELHYTLMLHIFVLNIPSFSPSPLPWIHCQQLL